MGRTLQKVTEILKQNLDEFRSGLDEEPQTQRISGFVVSSSFSGLSHEERQDLLWEKVLGGDKLTKDERNLLGPIVTMTPDEASIHAD